MRKREEKKRKKDELPFPSIPKKPYRIGKIMGPPFLRLPSFDGER